MKTRKIRLVALLVFAAMMILTVPVISSAEADPWASVTPSTRIITKADGDGTIVTAGGSDAMRRQTLSISSDYNFQLPFPANSQPAYTFSFSVMMEEGKPFMPLCFRERGYNDAGITSGNTGRSDVNLLTVAADGSIRAHSTKDAYTVIGKISSDKLTNITVCVDRTALTVSFFIDGSLKHTVPVPTDGSWLDAHKSWVQINMNPGTKTGTEENPLVCIHGAYSAINAKVKEDDALYFFHAFPHAINRLDSVQGTLGDSLALNFRFFSESATPAFEVNGEAVAATPVAGFEPVTVGGKTVRQFDATYAGIGPQNLTDTLTLAIKDGEDVKYTAKYSAAEYLDSLILAYPTNEKLINLVNALTVYSNEANAFLGRELPDYTTVLQDLDFDTRALATGQRQATSKIVDDGTGNKVWSSSCPDGTAQQMTVLGNFFAEAVLGETYTLSFRYKVVSSNGGDGFIIGGADQYRQTGSVGIAKVPVGEIGVWQDFSVTFVFDYKEPTCNYIGLNIEGLGAGQGAENAVYIDDMKLVRTETPGFTTVFYKSFNDSKNLALNQRGQETGASFGGAVEEGNRRMFAEGFKTYFNVIQVGALSGLTEGHPYRITLKYKVAKTIGEIANPTFDIRYTQGDRTADALIGTVKVGTVGEWETASFDFVCNKPDPANSDLSIYCNGLGAGTAEDMYKLFVDDIVISALDGTMPEGEKMLPTNAGDAQFKSANVLFDSQNKIVVKYTSATPVTAQINGVDVVSTDLGDGVWQIETEGISALNFNQRFAFTVGTSVLNYSVNDYVRAMKNNSGILMLAAAMYNYGVAAEAYATVE